MTRILASFCLFVMISTSGLFGQKIDMDLFHGIKPRNIGPAGMSGRVTAIAADPRNYDVMYIGTASGGLWKTTNGGITFVPVFDDQAVASIGALAVDPVRPDVIWAGTGEGNPRNSVTGGYGIYKSLDGGKSWKLSGLQETRHIHRIFVNPSNPDVVYAGAIGTPWGPSKERGVYKTTDGGATWQKVLFTCETCGVADMVIDPTNPDKLFVAMWNHQRWPWFFSSASDGSGLYLTLDGARSFSKVTKGLPTEVGRIGLAIARNKPEYVYAYVETKPSAIYRSTDGGFSWEKRGEKNIGNRPFYYAEIYVDPENENRVYSLFSSVNMSEDGGLTFPTTIAQSIHLDHHAWWINPANPSHMVDGNDGGMGITYDKGKTWRHIENLPAGQFYHVNVDNEMPYRVYGGLQDNGSWVGPAYAWYSGGLINEFWDFLIGGDGFDAMPVAGDPRYCYAQSQGGSVRRIDLLSGAGKSIRPAPQGGERLRFNWNSALAQDPFENNTIYFGSQFVHKSKDRGDTWEKISPDLTTNDPEKQKQSSSGGITIDATGAENHCTIITISPSKVQKDLIWAGTDDGNIQYTIDGGKNWVNVTENIKGAPKKAWVPQITASPHNPAEAFAVINNYRTGDYSAYLYYTNNFGKSWQRIIDDTDVWGYVICFVQDPIEPKLMFAGTEYGLFVSFDKGESWNKWTQGYPTVSTYDMVIQPRENDLVIGTFGRSIWIIDNIVPLRTLAANGSKMLNEKVVAFNSSPAVMASLKNLPGYYWRGDAQYEGQNRGISADISCYVAEADDEKLKVEIFDDQGILMRNFDTEVKKGFNRFTWRFEKNSSPFAGQITRGTTSMETDDRARFFRGQGANVIPGDYTIKLTYKGASSTSKVSVLSDPRLPAPDIKAMKENYRRSDEIVTAIKEVNALYQRFTEVNSTITKINELMSKNKAFAEAVGEIHNQIKQKYNQAESKLTSGTEGLFSKINRSRVLNSATTTLTESEEKTVKEALEAIPAAKKVMEDFINNEWPAYEKSLAGKNVPAEAFIK